MRGVRGDHGQDGGGGNGARPRASGKKKSGGKTPDLPKAGKRLPAPKAGKSPSSAKSKVSDKTAVNRALYDAVMAGNLVGVGVALQQGANPAAIIEEKPVILHAIDQKNTDLIDVFLGSGIPIDRVYSLGGITQESDSLLTHAIGRKDPDIALIRHLLQQGANPDKAVDRFLPLPLAANWGHTAVMEILLDAGADIDKRDGQMQRTALHEAALDDNRQAFEMLLLRGARPDIKDRNGHTPLDMVGTFKLKNLEGAVLEFVRKGVETLRAEKGYAASQKPQDSPERQGQLFEAFNKGGARSARAKAGAAAPSAPVSPPCPIDFDGGGFTLADLRRDLPDVGTNGFGLAVLLGKFEKVMEKALRDKTDLITLADLTTPDARGLSPLMRLGARKELKTLFREAFWVGRAQEAQALWEKVPPEHRKQVDFHDFLNRLNLQTLASKARVFGTRPKPP